VHELSLCGAIVEAVARHARGRRVTSVKLSVGRLRQVMPESLEFYFGFVAEGTVCEGARLEQTAIPAQLRCGTCKHEWAPEWPLFLCPACDGSEISVVGGDEFAIESIEVEEASSASPRSEST
jgi:hydrogenase nickel incorporation protein HypA/HybF